MRIDILTIFPDVFRGVLAESMLRLARERGKAAYHLTDLRDSTTDRHRSVDDRPFGGGPGMVFKVEPVVEGVREIEKRGREALGLGSDARPVRILTSPQGERFTQAVADELSKENWLLFIAGHYEGYDERIRTILQPRELSIGDYVLTGGELAAMVMIDSVVRLLPTRTAAVCWSTRSTRARSSSRATACRRCSSAATTRASPRGAARRQSSARTSAGRICSEAARQHLSPPRRQERQGRPCRTTGALGSGTRQTLRRSPGEPSAVLGVIGVLGGEGRVP